MSKVKYSVIILPDTHLPFTAWNVIYAAHKYYLQLLEAGEKVKVIQIGDLTDQKAWSRFQKDPDDYSPDLEWKEIVKQFNKLKKLFPEMTVILGNHDRRIMMRAVEASIPSALIKTLPELFDAPGWNFHTSNVPFQFQGVTYIHGDEFAGTPIIKAQHVGTPLVMGHTHKASITYGANPVTSLWAMEVGHALDSDSPAARYVSRNINKGTMGFGYIDINSTPHYFRVK